MACPSEAVSEEYFQFVIDFELTPEVVESSGVNFCNVQVGNGISIVYITESELSKIEKYLRRYTYVPKCYGLMQEQVNQVGQNRVYGSNQQNVNLQPLEASGILRVQNRPLSLTGKGVVMAFLDTGERVIIMSS
jgi:hypothetical protein